MDGHQGADDALEQRIDLLLGEMTLEEKVAQMHGRGLIMGVWRTPDNGRLGIPGLTMIDGPRGVSALAGNGTAFPVSMARGASWDIALEERVGEAIGLEAKARTASVLLAPTLNILRHPRWGRAQETYGEDTFHIGRMGVAFIRGAQRHVIASVKHLAANSIEDVRTEVDVLVDERTLREVYLPHFRMAVQEARVGSVMLAYNRLNGQYCAENTHLLRDILKGEWGFQGFVESDWDLGTRSTVPSAMAGLDIEMPHATFYGASLAAAVAKGEVPEDVLDEAVRRILRAKLGARLDTRPLPPLPAAIENPYHIALAREAARKSIVLLKNNHGVLPIEPGRVRSIAVIGALAALANIGDRGSSRVQPSYVVTALDGIRARAGAVIVRQAPVARLSQNDELVVAAADLVIVVAGLTADDEGEGQIASGDRRDLRLPGEQDALIAAVAALNPRTVVILEGGGAITMPWVDEVAAILMAWYPGQEGGHAIAEVLFGDVNPSGKLPLSFPRAESDLPDFVNDAPAVTYGYYHGYRHLDRQGVEPLFPFGFGLTYTTFEYSNLLAPARIEREGVLRISADVTNTGAMGGEEVVQLYVSYEGSRVDRAVRDLKGFARVHLEPGETKTVGFELNARDLAFFDVQTGNWEVEFISYRIWVGPSSAELPLAASFEVVPDGGAVATKGASDVKGASERLAFRPGQVWRDNNGRPINAHGAGILFHEGTYYWFGEHKIAGEAGNRAHVGVHVYRSSDLYHWDDEGIALSVLDHPGSELTPGCILERPKVVYNRLTGKFVMWFHLEPKGAGYAAARSGVAVADSPAGPYRFLGSFRPNAGVWPNNAPPEVRTGLTPDEDAYLGGLDLRDGPQTNFPGDLIFRRDFAFGQMARDMTLFVDDDGVAYHLYCSEENGALHISQLSADYLRPAGRYVRALSGGFHEAPALMKWRGRYFMITSNCTGWRPNPARLSMAESIWGPWKELGNPCVGTDRELGTTFESQGTHILPLAGVPDAYIFMADRWRPRNAIDGRYVWLPIQFRGGTPTLAWMEEWDLGWFTAQKPDSVPKASA